MIFPLFDVSLQGSLVRMVFLGPVNISTVVWGSTVWLIEKQVKENVSVWSAANHITNLCADLTANSTRTTVSFTKPPVWPIRE